MMTNLQFFFFPHRNLHLFYIYFYICSTLNKIINTPCGTLKLLLALGVAKYIKSYKIHFVVQYATDYCPLEHDSGIWQLI